MKQLTLEAEMFLLSTAQLQENISRLLSFDTVLGVQTIKPEDLQRRIDRYIDSYILMRNTATPDLDWTTIFQTLTRYYKELQIILSQYTDICDAVDVAIVPLIGFYVDTIEFFRDCTYLQSCIY